MYIPFLPKKDKVTQNATHKLSTSMQKNNSWYYFNKSSDTVIIFVHGFLSNSNTCWRSKSGQFWPDIIREDPRLCDPSIFLAGYHTAYDSASYKVQDCAKEVIRALERVDAQGCPAPISAPNILFICHSLGGVVARYILTAHTEKFTSKTVGILLMASPSIGSKYADSLSGLIKFYRNKVGKQLLYMNDTLTDLDQRFKILIEDGQIQNLVGGEAIEHHFLFKIPLLPGFKRVVSDNSASRYFGSSQTLPGTNHSTIVKPENTDGQGHLFLCDFFVRKFKPLRTTQNTTPFLAITGNKIAADPQKIDGSPLLPIKRILFDIYSPDCAPYYLKRSIDEELRKSLSLCSIWVSGPSGCGKTSAVRHLIHQNNYQPLEICLAHCQGNLSADRIIQEIVVTAHQRRGLGKDQSEPCLSDLIEILANYAVTSPIVLYIDEVPVSENDTHGLDELVTLVASLLDSVKQKTGKENIRFVISSIQSPRHHSSTITSKFAEQMLTIDLPLWSDQELDDLLNSLMGQLQLSHLDTIEKDDLVRTATGLPRFIKAYLRNKVIHTKADHQELLEMTTGQMVV